MAPSVELAHLIAHVAHRRYGCQRPHETVATRTPSGTYLEFYFYWGETTYCVSVRLTGPLMGGADRAVDQAAWRLAEHWRDGVGQSRVLDEARAILQSAVSR